MKTVVILFGIVFLILCAEGFQMKDFVEVQVEDYPSMFCLNTWIVHTE